MRSIKILILLAVLSALKTNAQTYVQTMGFTDYSFWNQLNIGNRGAKLTDPSAFLELGSLKSKKGLLLPRGNKDSVVSPAPGLLFFDIPSNTMVIWTGVGWANAAVPALGYGLLYSNNAMAVDTNLLKAVFAAGSAIAGSGIARIGNTFHVGDTLTRDANFFGRDYGVSFGLSYSDRIKNFNVYSRAGILLHDTINGGYSPSLNLSNGSAVLQGRNLNLYALQTNTVQAGNQVTITAQNVLVDAASSYKISGRPQTNDTTTNKVMTYNPVTGDVKWSNWKASAPVPTLQQVISQGSSMDYTNNIYGNSQDLNWQNFGFMGFNTLGVNISGGSLGKFAHATFNQKVELASSDGSKYSSLLFTPDSAVFALSAGAKMKVRNLNPQTDTARKIVTYDPVSKELAYLPAWPGFGGGSLTLQQVMQNGNTTNVNAIFNQSVTVGTDLYLGGTIESSSNPLFLAGAGGVKLVDFLSNGELVQAPGETGTIATRAWVQANFPVGTGFQPGDSLFYVASPLHFLHDTAAGHMDSLYADFASDTSDGFITSLQYQHFKEAYDKYTVSGTYNAGTITFTRKDGTTYQVSGIATGGGGSGNISGSLTAGRVTLSAASGSVTDNPNLTFDGNHLTISNSQSGTYGILLNQLPGSSAGFGIQSANNGGHYFTIGQDNAGPWRVRAVGMPMILDASQLSVTALAGTGTQMVTADASGALSRQDLPVTPRIVVDRSFTNKDTVNFFLINFPTARYFTIRVRDLVANGVGDYAIRIRYAGSPVFQDFPGAYYYNANGGGQVAAANGFLYFGTSDPSNSDRRLDGVVEFNSPGDPNRRFSYTSRFWGVGDPNDTKPYNFVGSSTTSGIIEEVQIYHTNGNYSGFATLEIR